MEVNVQLQTFKCTIDADLAISNEYLMIFPQLIQLSFLVLFLKLIKQLKWFTMSGDTVAIAYDHNHVLIAFNYKLIIF